MRLRTSAPTSRCRIASTESGFFWYLYFWGGHHKPSLSFLEFWGGLLLPLRFSWASSVAKIHDIDSVVIVEQSDSIPVPWRASLSCSPALSIGWTGSDFSGRCSSPITRRYARHHPTRCHALPVHPTVAFVTSAVENTRWCASASASPWRQKHFFAWFFFFSCLFGCSFVCFIFCLLMFFVFLFVRFGCRLFVCRLMCFCFGLSVWLSFVCLFYICLLMFFLFLFVRLFVCLLMCYFSVHLLLRFKPAQHGPSARVLRTPR